MKTSAEVALVDANVLVYALFRDAEQHLAAYSLFERAQNGELRLGLTTQVLAEFYAVITNARRVSAPYTPDEALAELDKYVAMRGIEILPIPFDVVRRWTDLARCHPVKGGAIFDLQLAATMLGNGVHRIYTYNTKDFEELDGIEVLKP